MKPTQALAAIIVALSVAAAAVPPTAAVGCPVTIPNASPFPPGGGSFTSLDGRPSPTHGNGQLWVGYLSPNGVLTVREDGIDRDGSIELKFAWARRIVEYRTVDGALTGIFAGDLSIDVRRLDAPAPAARVYTDASGVHVTSVITFPTTGCWEVTGRAGTDSLTFVFQLTIEGQPVPSTAMDPPRAPLVAIGIGLLVASVAYTNLARHRRSAAVTQPLSGARR
jgi:hypothetical protein